MNEQEMQTTAIVVVEQANTYMVGSQQEYDNAAEILKEVKHRMNQIVDYWKPLKEKAYGAWKDICAKEKQLTDPFTKAETIIKGKMADWKKAELERIRAEQAELERQRKEEEEMIRKAAELAADEGDTERFETMAEAAISVAAMPIAQPEVHKTKDTSAKVVWKARITEPGLVPVEMMGIEIRPINQSALDKLAQLSKGQAKIPGVVMHEDIQISARAR